MKTLIKSLRWRIQAWYGLLLLLLMLGFCFPAYKLSRDNHFQRIDLELGQAEHRLMPLLMESLQTGNDKVNVPIHPSDFLVRIRALNGEIPAAVRASFNSQQEGSYYFSIQDAEGVVLLQTDNAPADLNPLPIPASGLIEETRSVGQRREHCRSSWLGLRMVVGRDISPDLAQMRRLGGSLIISGFTVWCLGLLGGWWLSGRAIQPIATISQTATRIAEGNIAERINIAHMESELGQLSRVLNQTFDRLQATFERQRQFTGDASHELRTPITILLAETQRILKRERSPEEYREVLVTCSETAERMRRLVEALLMLARQDDENRLAVNDPCDLDCILAEVIHQLTPLAQERGFHIQADLKKAHCSGDAAALAILMSNLVRNALQHGGNVWVSSSEQAAEAVIIVRDEGPGIAENHLPHLFDRFYRVDQARTGSSGHAGLGLAIAKAIVTNHRGSLKVTSAVGQGTCFEVRLPAA